MIQIKDLSLLYNEEEALSRINIEIDETMPHTVVGKSGCGKSSLLYTMLSLVKPTKGTVWFEGELAQDFAQKTSVLLQSYGILPWKTVLANVVFVARSKGIAKDKARIAALETIGTLGILSCQNKYPGQLSGGQRQRAALACAMVANPVLMFLDEPTSALDSFTKEAIGDLLLELFLNKKMSYIMITHDIQEAVFLGKRIVVMKKAGICQVFDNPFFGIQSARNELGFYEFCLSVRRVLNEES